MSDHLRALEIQELDETRLARSLVLQAQRTGQGRYRIGVGGHRFVTDRGSPSVGHFVSPDSMTEVNSPEIMRLASNGIGSASGMQLKISSVTPRWHWVPNSRSENK